MSETVKKGNISIISGFSGTGKGTVVDRLLADYEGKYSLSISATSRKPRLVKGTDELEQEGVHYFFKTREEFEEMIKENALLEYAEYAGNYYGTPLGFVMNKLEEGCNILLEIEQQGAFKVKDSFPEVLLIFLAPPSIEELVARLRGRGNNTEDEIKARLRQAYVESRNIEKYDYIIVNADLDECIIQMNELINHPSDFESRKICNNLEFMKKLQDDLEIYK